MWDTIGSRTYCVPYLSHSRFGIAWNRREHQDTTIAALTGHLRAARNLRESSGTPKSRMLCALRRFGDNPDRICRGSAVAELRGIWLTLVSFAPTIWRRLDRGGDRQGDAHVRLSS